MRKLLPAKIFSLPCEMQMMLILLISYYGLYLPFVSFEFSSGSFDAQLFNI